MHCNKVLKLKMQFMEINSVKEKPQVIGVYQCKKPHGKPLKRQFHKMVKHTTRYAMQQIFEIENAIHGNKLCEGKTSSNRSIPV